MLGILRDSYTLMGALGLLLAVVVLYCNLTVAKAPHATVIKLCIALMLCFVVGICFANMGNWVLKRLLALPLAQRVASAGLTWYPGILGFWAAYALAARLLGEDVAQAVHAAVPAIPAFHAVGRVGCVLAGCCYGIPKTTVTFDANGPAVSATSRTVEKGAEIQLLNAPAYTGYTFTGWYTAASGSQRVGGAGDSYTVTDNITLYAQWTQKKSDN